MPPIICGSILFSIDVLSDSERHSLCQCISTHYVTCVSLKGATCFEPVPDKHGPIPVASPVLDLEVVVGSNGRDYTHPLTLGEAIRRMAQIYRRGPDSRYDLSRARAPYG
jgi:hypothetical protein